MATARAPVEWMVGSEVRTASRVALVWVRAKAGSGLDSIVEVRNATPAAEAAAQTSAAATNAAPRRPGPARAAAP